MESIVIISGSHRESAQSRRVANYVGSRCNELFKARPEVLDLEELKIPFFGEDFRRKDSPWPEIWAPISGTLANSRGVILVSPEWGGMVPPGLKNLLVLCSANELGHKPGLLIGVSASRGGAYPIAELRTTGYKNNKLCFMPDHIIVRNVKEMLNGANPSDPDDLYIRERIDWTLEVFAIYVQAFDTIRQHGEVLGKREYRYGM